MKKTIATLSAIPLTGSLVAGGVQQNTNQSAEWAQTGNRNASLLQIPRFTTRRVRPF